MIAVAVIMKKTPHVIEDCTSMIFHVRRDKIIMNVNRYRKSRLARMNAENCSG